MDQKENIVFSKNVIEFVTVAKEFCKMVENIKILTSSGLASQSQKILPLLYIKAALLPELQPEEGESTEKFLKEFELNYVRNKIEQKLESGDVILRITNEMNPQDEKFATESVSELFTDIYEEVFNFISAYRSGEVKIMNDATWECRQNFEISWGIKLLALVNALHLIVYKVENNQ